MERVLQAIDRFTDYTGKIVSWLIVVLTVLVVTEVILRRFFNSPTIWSFEVTQQIFAFHFMLLAPYALLHRSHVAVDIFHEKLSDRKRAVLDVVSYLIFFFPFLAVVLWQGIPYAANSWGMRETSFSSFSPPLYYVKTLIPATAFLLLLQGGAIFLRQLRFAIKGVE